MFVDNWFRDNKEDVKILKKDYFLKNRILVLAWRRSDQRHRRPRRRMDFEHIWSLSI